MSTVRGSAMQNGARELFTQSMRSRLAKKPWIADHCKKFYLVSERDLDLNSYAVIPGFPVACRRLTPGPGYLEALCEDNV